MNQRDAGDLPHGSVTRFFEFHLTSKEIAVRYVAADFRFSREERFEFQLFDALRRDEKSAFAPLYLFKHDVVAQSFERCRHFGLFSFARQIADTVNILQKVFPYRSYGHAHAFIRIRNGNDAHQLREVRITCRSNQQSIRLCWPSIAAALLTRCGPQPWTMPLAES